MMGKRLDFLPNITTWSLLKSFFFACMSFRSRLGCQVCLRKELDGMILRVPDVISDARVDSEKESSTAPPKV